MDIQEIHEKYDYWTYGNVGAVVLLDKEGNELKTLDVNDLISLWFDKQDKER